MPTLAITTPHTTVQLQSKRLILTLPNPEDPHNKTGTTQQQIPLHDIDRLILNDTIHITLPALTALLHHQIPIVLLSHPRHVLGTFLPTTNHHGHTRLTQYRLNTDPTFTLEIARNLITAKIYNQRRTLQRIALSRKTDITTTLDTLQTTLQKATKTTTLDTLRGLEGYATATYYTTWATFLPPDFPFQRRTRRPPLNPVNALLSFTSTLIYHETVAYLHAHGLDPALGHLHTTQNGRFSLALDLIEPFRPLIVEPLTLDLLSHRTLNTTHFQTNPEDGGTYLTNLARNPFFLQYERRLQRQFNSEHTNTRTTLRDQLEHTTTQYKTALTEGPQHLNPLLIN